VGAGSLKPEGRLQRHARGHMDGLVYLLLEKVN
jgi:hypothetical protein